MPILNPVEMNMPSENFVVDRLKGIQGYKTLFAQAFPDAKDPITYENLKNAIGAFERTLSTPGKFHQYLAGDANALNAEEKAGLKKFIEVGCITCHISATVGGNMFQKFPLIGQEYKSFTGSKTEDLGKMDVSKKESDKFIFKVPSLLNIGKTAPYFHDGSVADLGQAIQIMGKLQLNKDLNDGDVSEIKAFLHALTADVPKDALIIPEMPK
ncbi:MAG: c-type cytochrome [Bacteroidia bacterium]|nr:c-type cytochrome [Bacteroidia bacterium]